MIPYILLCREEGKSSDGGKNVEARLNSFPTSTEWLWLPFCSSVMVRMPVFPSCFVSCEPVHMCQSKYRATEWTVGWEDEDHEKRSSGPNQRRSINVSARKGGWSLSPPPWGCSSNYFLRDMTVSPRCSSWYGVEAEGPSQIGLSSHFSMCLDAKLLFYSFRGSVWVFPMC